MGLRFTKHINLGKHLRLNISKSGIGISGGVKGARISYNPKTGVRKSIGIPGTGIYYSEQHKVSTDNKAINKIPLNFKKIRLIPVTIIGLILCVVGLAPIGVFLLVGCFAWNHNINKNNKLRF